MTNPSRSLARRAVTALLLGTSLCAVTPAVHAATAAPAAAAADEATLGEIVVTARNREEKLQDVPLAITSFNSQALSNANVRNLRDISFLTPGLSITSGGSEFGVNPVIRGQTNLNGGAGDPNVAVFIDGVYISNNSAINVGLIDMERVEVVKGPVSALYGRNAFAGAINYVSKKPSLTEAHGAITSFAGNDQQYSVSGNISYPVIKDMLAVKLAAGYEHFGGSYKDAVNGNRAGGYKKRDINGSVLFKPVTDLTIDGSWYYGNDKFGPAALAYNANNCGTKPAVAPVTDPNGTGYTQFCGRFDPQAHPVEVPNTPSLSNASGNTRKVNLGRLNTSYDFGGVKLTSLTGFVKTQQQRFTDFIGRRAGIPFQLVPGPGTVNLLELFGSNTNTKDFSEEVRLQSDGDQKLRWQVGGFYYKGRTFSTTIIGIDGTPIPAGQTITGGFGQAIDYVTVGGAISQKRITQALSHDKQYSGFAGLEYDVFEGFTASGEYRYTHQKKDQLIIRNTGCPSYLVANTATCNGPLPTPYLYPNGTTPAAGTFNFSNYRGVLKYQATPGVNVYASIANGTKAGGFNQRATVPADLEFNPEKNTTYEIGIKNSLFGNRLQFNVAAYHVDTKGIQISGPSSDPNNAGLVTKNFGSVHTNGFEVELAAKVADGVHVHTGVAYADPKFGKDAYDYSAGAGCLVVPQCAGRVVVAAPGTPLNPSTAAGNTNKTILSLSGLHLPRESNVQFTGGVDLEGPINESWKWTSTFNARYESRNYAFNNNISYYGPRTVVNVRAGVENANYSVALYVNNLTNDETPEIVSSNARLNDFVGDPTGYLPIGREFGVIVGAKF